MSRPIIFVGAAAALMLGASPAAADFPLESFFTGADAPRVDADFGEWSDAEGEELAQFVPLGEEDRVSGEGSWNGEEDISGEIAVAHNDDGFYAAVKITDQRLIRTKKLFTNEDHVAFWFAAPKKKKGKLAVQGVGVYADPTRYKAPVEIRFLKPGKPKAGGPVRGATAAVTVISGPTK